MLIVAMLALAAPAAPLNLQLLCSGTGAQTKVDPSTTFNHGDGRYDVGVIDDVRIDITGQTGRIRIPPPMMPKLHGGKDGWFTLSDVVAGPDEITAKASINPLNKVRVKLNRLNGGLTLNVLHGEYHGRCAPFADDTPRAF